MHKTTSNHEDNWAKVQRDWSLMDSRKMLPSFPCVSRIGKLQFRNSKISSPSLQNPAQDQPHQQQQLQPDAQGAVLHDATEPSAWGASTALLPRCNGIIPCSQIDAHRHFHAHRGYKWLCVYLGMQTGDFMSATKDRTQMWQHKIYQNSVQERNCHSLSQIYFVSNPAAGKDYRKAPTGLLGAAYALHVDALAQGTASSVQGWHCSVSLQAQLVKPKGLQFP